MKSLLMCLWILLVLVGVGCCEPADSSAMLERHSTKADVAAPEDENASASLLGSESPEAISNEEILGKIKPHQQRGSEAVRVASCAVVNCHGLEIQCGAVTESLTCDASYHVGDFCRAFAKCEEVEGACQFVNDAAFDQCKRCVDQCQSIEDVKAIMSCESRCREEMDSK